MFSKAIVKSVFSAEKYSLFLKESFTQVILYLLVYDGSETYVRLGHGSVSD